jgi:hypothetical protein
MTDFPVPLDNLIKYVQALHPGGGPLDRVSDAFSTSETAREHIKAEFAEIQAERAKRAG